ncbi:MAG: hypothetical protein RL160_1051 [Bacteroidota bacterium]|jgi:hypothetical protein
MEQHSSEKNNREYWTGIHVMPVLQGQLPLAVSFYLEQVYPLVQKGQYSWLECIPTLNEVLHFAWSGENLAGMCIGKPQHAAASVLVAEAYLGGGTFLRLLQALDAQLLPAKSAYTIFLPDSEQYRQLTIASGCLLLSRHQGVITAQRTMSKTLQKHPSYA